MDDKLLHFLALTKGDPLAFTMGAYPWGQPGTVLESSDGPRVLVTCFGFALLEPLGSFLRRNHPMKSSTYLRWITAWWITAAAILAFGVFAKAQTLVTATASSDLTVSYY